MGVPQFFSWLSRKYKGIVSSGFKGDVDAFLMDFNCLIYQVWRDLCHNEYDILKDKNKSFIENRIIEEVIKYMKRIIFEIVKPKKYVYVAFDGTVPRAKMNQQRFRRFKKDVLDDMDKRIAEKYGIFKEKIWDTNCITPGTEFMYKLSEGIKNAMKSSFGVQDSNLQFFLSDTSVPGEGEHKVMNNLRNQDIRGKYCVYGLDADLIYLSLLSGYNITLLRENTDDRVDAEFLWVYVKELGDAIVKEFQKLLPLHKLIKQAIINDYCFMGFLVGNDFCHCTPSLKIGENGIDLLINTYSKFFNGKYLLDRNYNINQKFMELILSFISRNEHQNLVHLQKRSNRRLTPPSHLDSYQLDKFCNDRIPLNDDFKKYWNVIDYMGDKDYRRKYNKLLLDSGNIDDICQKYIEGLIFTRNYYFKRMISWEWYNPYLNAPFMRDVWRYINEKRINFNNVAIPIATPYTAYEQLLMVLPPQNRDLLPKCLGDGMVQFTSPIIEYYPREFKLDLYEKFMLYSAEPILPLIESNKIREFFKDNAEKLTDKEKELNKKGITVLFKRK